MSKSRPAREAAKPLRLFVNPFAIWNEAVLKGGEAMLASMQAAAAKARSPRVGMIPTANAPPKRKAGPKRKLKANQKKKKAKPRYAAARSRQVVRRRSRRAARS